MKKIFYYGSLLFIFSCNSNRQPGDQSTAKDTTHTNEASPNNPVVVTSKNGGSDHPLWIGLFAQWKKTAVEIVDGKYDTTNHIFFACQATAGFPVDAQNVVLRSTSTCDQVQGTEVSVLERIVRPSGLDSFTKVHSVITLTDTNELHPKATLILHDKLTPLVLDQESIRRLNATKKVMNNVEIKKN